MVPHIPPLHMLSDCEKVASEPQIDCGLFLVKTGGEERILALDFRV